MNTLKIILNDDEELVEMVKNGLKAKNGYCPCKVGCFPENKCICKEFRNQQEPGTCHCGLYKKVEVSNEK